MLRVSLYRLFSLKKTQPLLAVCRRTSLYECLHSFPPVLSLPPPSSSFQVLNTFGTLSRSNQAASASGKRTSRILSHLDHLMTYRPCLSTSINTGFVMGLGDIVAQVVLESRGLAGFELFRACRFVGVGLFLAGPGMHFWYSALDKHVSVESKWSQTVRKTLLDQLLFLPFYLVVYLLVLALLRRDSRNEIEQRFARDMFTCLVVSYKVWPVVQVINFYLLPPKFRVLFINFIALFWNTYIGWKAEKGLKNI